MTERVSSYTELQYPNSLTYVLHYETTIEQERERARWSRKDNPVVARRICKAIVGGDNISSEDNPHTYQKRSSRRLYARSNDHETLSLPMLSRSLRNRV